MQSPAKMQLYHSEIRSFCCFKSQLAAIIFLKHDREHRMNANVLLNALRQKITDLEQRALPLANKPISSALFDRALFSRKHSNLKGYLSELDDYFTQLEQCVTKSQIEQVRFLAEKIVAQMEALSRELSTQGLRQKENAYQKRDEHVDLYQRLAQHQDYERRLSAMIDDRELTLGREPNFAQQQKMQKEIAMLAGRLARCRQALYRIERNIERYERNDF